MARGPIILFEGLDRTGKSTQTQVLLSALQSRGIKSQLFRFPNRETELGKMINTYLQGGSLNDQTAHLLFSANRWECSDALIASSEAGDVVIIDRYIFSGVAYSAAKGLDRQWCMTPDLGLPKPDVVFFLKFKDSDKASERGAYGEERYEKVEFQRLVKEQFEKLEQEGDWQVIYVDDKSIEQVAQEVWERVERLVRGIDGSIKKFTWMLRE